MADNGRTTREIEEEIELCREDLALTVHELQVAVKSKLDWRRPIRQRPLPAVGGAMALGFLLAML